MLIAHFFDLVPIWLLLIGTILVMVLFIEYGFRLGKHAQATECSLSVNFDQEKVELKISDNGQGFAS